MPERNGYPAGVPCWIDTTQPDPDKAAEFYSGLFGWDLEDVMPPGSPGKYFIGLLRGGDVAAISSRPEGAPPGAVWNTYIWVDSADESAAKVTEAGGTVLSEPFDVMDAGRMAIVADPEGAAFCLWQAKRHRGARVVNEPGALNFNGLTTRDPERAAAFYGAVFGWKLAGGMWQLPRYGDYLEERTPGLKARTREFGAPEGFEDGVAAINPPADGPAQWTVTFGAGDADAVAARAKELGGEIVLEPFDAPWVRMTVITDPQGATFTASQFVPENKDLPSQAGATAA